MIRWIVAAVLLLSSFVTQAQDRPAPAPDSSGKVIYTQVEQPPEFPGDLGMYFRNSVVYPRKAVEEGTEGVVYVTFVITESGTIEDVKIKASESEDLDAEAIRVIKAMPKWKPARQGGKDVAVYYTTPVRFEISN